MPELVSDLMILEYLRFSLVCQPTNTKRMNKHTCPTYALDLKLWLSFPGLSHLFYFEAEEKKPKWGGDLHHPPRVGNS